MEAPRPDRHCGQNERQRHELQVGQCQPGDHNRREEGEPPVLPSACPPLEHRVVGQPASNRAHKTGSTPIARRFGRRKIGWIRKRRRLWEPIGNGRLRLRGRRLARHRSGAGSNLRSGFSARLPLFAGPGGDNSGCRRPDLHRPGSMELGHGTITLQTVTELLNGGFRPASGRGPQRAGDAFVGGRYRSRDFGRLIADDVPEQRPQAARVLPEIGSIPLDEPDYGLPTTPS